MNIVHSSQEKVKTFFEERNFFKTLQCETVTEFWTKRSASHIIEHAERYKQIQVNSRQITQCLAFDIDHDDALIYQDFNLPTPSIITLNADNGRSHILYYLKTPVNAHSERAKRYLADIYDAVTNTLQADTNYTTINTKNFLNDELYRVCGSLNTYNLSDFRAFLHADKAKVLESAKKRTQSYFSRNIELFDTVRFYAYKVKRDFETYESFYKHVLEKAQQVNASIFDKPLPSKEAKHTAKSIAGWTWENETPGTWNWDGYIKKDKSEVSVIRSKAKKLDRRKNITARLARQYDSLQCLDT